MKHRIFLVIALAALPLCAKGEKLTLDEARKMAEFYYSALDSITAKPDRATAIEMKIEEYFKRNTSFPVPNDLHFVYGNGSIGENTTIDARNYISYLQRIAEKGNILLKYKITHCDYLTGPELDKKADPMYVEVHIKRELFHNGQKLDDILDRMVIHRDNHTPIIRNRYGGMRADVKTLIATAYSLYQQKEYDEAFRMFQTALELNPKDEDVSYRMGVMASKEQGCKQYPKKIRKHLATYYFMKTLKGVNVLQQYYGIKLTFVQGKYGEHYLAELAKEFDIVGSGGLWALHDSEMSSLLLSMSNNFLVAPLGKLDYNPFIHNRMLAYDRKNRKFGHITTDGKVIGYAMTHDMALPFDSTGKALVLDVTYMEYTTAERLVYKIKEKGYYIRNLYFVDTNHNRLSEYYHPRKGVTFFSDGRFVAWNSMVYDRVSGKILDFGDTIDCIYQKPDAPTLIRTHSQKGYGLSKIDAAFFFAPGFKNLWVINWDSDKAYVAVNYDPTKAIKICEFKDSDGRYNMEYLNQFDPDTWVDIGMVIEHSFNRPSEWKLYTKEEQQNTP